MEAIELQIASLLEASLAALANEIIREVCESKCCMASKKKLRERCNKAKEEKITRIREEHMNEIRKSIKLSIEK